MYERNCSFPRFFLPWTVGALKVRTCFLPMRDEVWSQRAWAQILAQHLAALLKVPSLLQASIYPTVKWVSNVFTTELF